MRKRIIAASCAVAALALWLWFGGDERTEVPAASPVRAPLTSYLTTNGRVQAGENHQVFAEVSGTVRRLPAEEGDRVKQGDVLAVIESAEARAQLKQAKARVTAAKADLAEIERGGTPREIAELEAKLAAARREQQTAAAEVAAVARLVEKSAAPEIDLQQARARLAAAETDAGLLEKKLSLGSAPEARQRALARIREAEAELEKARERAAATVVRSPAAGTVYSLDLEPGVFVERGRLIARVGRLAKVRVVIFVDEPELGRVRLSQPVLIESDAYPGRRWEGKVERLATEIITLETRRVGELLTRVDNPNRELVPRLTVSVRIETASVENALTVPREAVLRDAEGPFVWLLSPERTAVRRAVTLGVRNERRVQVVSGVEEADRVLLPGAADLRPGQAVEPVEKPAS